MKIRVLIADDEALVRHALGVFVESAEDMVLVGMATDGEEALRLCQSASPDVVLMDIQMPVMDGIAATAEIVRRFPAVSVIAVTTFSSERSVLAALKAGAAGYVVKDTEPVALLDAVRSVHRGGNVLSPSVTKQLIELVRESTAESSRPLSADETLSDREREVVDLLAQGLSNREIAAALFLSDATVKTHLRSIMTKWNVRDRVQVVVRAANAGIISLK